MSHSQENTSGSSQEVKPSGERMSDADFAAASERYELGKDTLVSLAAEYGVSRQALSKRFKNNGVVRGSRAHEIAEAIKKGAQEAAKEAGATATRFQDKRAAWIEETRVQGFTALKQVRMLGQKTLVDAVKSGSAVASIEDDVKTIQRYGKFLSDNIETSLRILDSDNHIDEEDLPSLFIEDLTDEEILEHHKMTGALPEDATLEDLNLEEDGE